MTRGVSAERGSGSVADKLRELRTSFDEPRAPVVHQTPASKAPTEAAGYIRSRSVYETPISKAPPTEAADYNRSQSVDSKWDMLAFSDPPSEPAATRRVTVDDSAICMEKKRQRNAVKLPHIGNATTDTCSQRNRRVSLMEVGNPPMDERDTGIAAKRRIRMSLELPNEEPPKEVASTNQMLRFRSPSVRRASLQADLASGEAADVLGRPGFVEPDRPGCLKFEDKQGAPVYVPRKTLEEIKRFFLNLDADHDGVVDVQEVEKYSSTATCESTPASYILAASFPELRNQKDVRRLERALREKKILTFPDLLKAAYPRIKNEDFGRLASEVDHLEKDWELLANPQGVAAERNQRARETDDWKQWIDEMWPIWDADGSGELDEEEFKSVVQDIGASPEDAEEFFVQIDMDGSGTISVQEFHDWWIGKGMFAQYTVINGGARERETKPIQSGFLPKIRPRHS
ncbi:hypothetical protein CYMTET_47656 [Cymbomonas tetramitiformis]|uniref:EF-hand domain-containing protein n=1 Tax=Cymbomonas tetramitiformis TaxID=36881 RepID=A0AAE0BVK9_9CHLO|nr:hypothetical protein CYMTET_47656 [Cymbomonas tetramitiformis]